MTIQEESRETRTVKNPRETGPELAKAAVAGPKKSIEIIPVTKVRYHTNINFYSNSDGVVFPLNPTSGYAKRMVDSLLSGLEKGKISGEKTDSKLLIVNEKEEK